MKTFAAAAIVMTTAFSAQAIEQGAQAPEFAAKNQDGKTVMLASLKGKPVVLYFYPKDETPGCTKEACSFRDEYQKFRELGAVVLGVSRQDAKSHQEFKSKHKLPFDLLVDSDGTIAKKYGVNLMPVVGLHQRQTVLIDRDGKVARFYEKVDPATHTQEVYADLKKLAATSPAK